MRTGSDDVPLRRSHTRVRPCPVIHDASLQPFPDQAGHPPVANAVLKERNQPIPRDGVKIRLQIRVDDPVDLAPFDPEGQGIERIVRTATRPEPVTETKKLRLINWRQDHIHNRFLDDLVLQCRDPERSYPAVRLGYLYPPDRRRPVRSSAVQASVQVEQSLFQTFPVHRPRHAIDTSRRVLPQHEVGHAERLRRNMVEERRETLLRVSLYSLPYPVGCLWHACPTLRPVRALASRISLG